MVRGRIVVVVADDVALARLAGGALPLVRHSTEPVIAVADDITGWIHAALEIARARVRQLPSAGIRIVDQRPSPAAVVLIAASASPCVLDARQLARRVVDVASPDPSLPVALDDARETSKPVGLVGRGRVEVARALVVVVLVPDGACERAVRDAGRRTIGVLRRELSSRRVVQHPGAVAALVSRQRGPRLE